MIQPNFSTLSCARLLKANSKIRVECPFKDLSEVKKPISLTANAFPIFKECKGEKTTIKAKVIFTLVYLSEDGYKKATCEADAIQEVALENAVIDCFITDVKLITSNGFSGVCTLNFLSEGRGEESVDVLTGGENIIVKNKDVSIDIYNDYRQGRHTVVDEFSIDYTISEVLSYRAVAYLTSCNSSLGRIILEGEVVLIVKALPFSENNDIVKERRVIPFRYELDDVEALQEDRAYAVVDVTATNVKVFVDEAKEKSTVSVDVSLEFFGGTVRTQNFAVVEDAYLKFNESELETTKIDLLTFNSARCVSEKVVCTGEKAVEGGRIISSIGENVSIVSLKQTDGRVYLDGIINSDVVFKNTDNGIVSTPCESPFSIDFAVEGEVCGMRSVNWKDGLYCGSQAFCL